LDERTHLTQHGVGDATRREERACFAFALRIAPRRLAVAEIVDAGA